MDRVKGGEWGQIDIHLPAEPGQLFGETPNPFMARTS
jgi:hypothetical protein